MATGILSIRRIIRFRSHAGLGIYAYVHAAETPKHEHDVASSLPYLAKRNPHIGNTMPFALLWCLFWMRRSLHAIAFATLLVAGGAYNIHMLLPVARTRSFNIWFGVTPPIDKLGMPFGHTDPP